MEAGSQLLHQLTKVYAIVGNEVEDELLLVKGPLGIDHFHVQPELLHMVTRYLKGIFLVLARLVDGAKVFVGSHTHDATDRLYHIVFGNKLRCYGNLAAFDTLSRLYDHPHAHLDLALTGVEVVYLTSLREPHATYWNH